MPDPWPSGRDFRGAGAGTVAAAVDAALAPLLPPPVAPVGFRSPDVVPAAADTVDESRAYAGHDLADLADLLAGVLEDETRALGVLELEP